MQESAVQRLSSIVIRVPGSPAPLFNIFSNSLHLPASWALRSDPFFTGAGVQVGGHDILLMQVGRRQNPTHLYGLLFDLEPHTLSVLKERNLPHTPQIPYYEFDEHGWQVVAWNTVFLGGLMDQGLLSKQFFSAANRSPESLREKAALPTFFNRRMALPTLFDTIYRNGLTCAVAYSPAWAARRIAREPTSSGLELKGLSQINIRARDYPRALANWDRLLSPLPQAAEGVWMLSDGLQIQVTESDRSEISSMTWQVHSLNRAAQFLHRRSMLGRETSEGLVIDPAAVDGLSITLVQ